MSALSPRATDLLDQMEPGLGYKATEVQQFVPELSAEGVREVMQELWIARRVERVGYAGWRRVRSVETSSAPMGDPVPVTPEDLFDHDSFSGIFK